MSAKKAGGESPLLKISIALISAGAIIIGAIITARYIPNPFSDGSSQTNVTVRVADSKAAPIQGAHVVLFLGGNIFSAYSDQNGVAPIVVNPPSSGKSRIVVETSKYKIYDENVQLSQTMDVRLAPQDPNNRSIIVRVVDDSNSVPIDGAQVVVLTGGHTYSQSSDSNGLANFTAAFSGDTIDADISVSTPAYKIDRQRVTLRPDQVQDARLNPGAQKITVATFQPPPPKTTPSSKTLSPGQTVSGSIATSGQLDKYDYQGKTGEVPLVSVGTQSGNLGPAIRLYDPNGKLLKEGPNIYGRAELQSDPLPMNGTYAIVVSAAYTGDYGLRACVEIV